MAQEFATLYLHLPCELVDVLRGWSDDPKRLSRVVQYLIVGEQARRDERQRILGQTAPLIAAEPPEDRHERKRSGRR
jgi:hypothetical protein